MHEIKQKNSIRLNYLNYFLVYRSQKLKSVAQRLRNKPIIKERTVGNFVP